MHCPCCSDELPLDCHRCDTPKVKGHGIVCFLTCAADTAAAFGILSLLTFWFLLAWWMTGVDGVVPIAFWSVLAASHAVIFLILSLFCSMRAKWLRHKIVSMDGAYLDDEGSCCGGACAGSCGNAECGCGDEGGEHGGGCGKGGCASGSCGCGPEGCGPEGCGKGGCGAGGCGCGAGGCGGGSRRVG